MLILGIAYALLNGQGPLLAQCPGTGCTWAILGPNTSTYTINAGQTLCLRSGATFTGTINLNGGTLINCSQFTHSFTLNFLANPGQSVIKNYGDMILSTSTNQFDARIENYGYFRVAGPKQVDNGSVINNYGVFIYDANLTLQGDAVINNYNAFSVSGTYTNNASSTLNNYHASTFTALDFVANNNWYNQGTVQVTDSFLNQAAATATIDAGCITIGTLFHNSGTMNGTSCGTVTVTNTTTNTGTLSGTFAIVDLTPPGSAPFLDNPGGVIGGGITWTDCGCNGAVTPENCVSAPDEDGDCLIGCADPDCGVSFVERTIDEPIRYAVSQNSFTSWTSGTSDTSFTYPRAIAQDPVSGKIFVADYGNNRILRFSSLNDFLFEKPAEAVLGQSNFDSSSAATTATGLDGPQSIAFDTSGTLWVADNGNSRVLRFDNAASKATGAAADGVLGQPDFTSSGIATTQSGLVYARNVYIDDLGTLWINDRRRVLRHDNPASKPNGANADGILGQANFTSSSFMTTTVSVWLPQGIVKICDRLYVSDWGSNRIVWWDAPNTKPNGAEMDGVIGQAHFASDTSGLGQNMLDGPTDLITDDENRLYVVDNLNRRILILNDPLAASFVADFDVVLGQADFNSKIWSVSQTRNTSLAGMALLREGNRVYLAACDVNAHRVIVRGMSDLVTDENVDQSSILAGSDPAGAGGLTFAITAQPGIGTVTLDNASTGAFTYNAPGTCGVDQDTMTSFSYTITNANGCIDSSEAIVRINEVGPCGEICNNLIDDDGDGDIDCADADCMPDKPGSITTSNDTICEGISGENYSIGAVAGATSYDWTVPAGGTITAGQGTTSITVDWGNSGGNVCVRTFDGVCYSSDTCKPILLINPPVAPGIINH